MKARPKLWRQGDVLIQQVESIPGHYAPAYRKILFRGEASGHCHALKEGSDAELLVLRGFGSPPYLKVGAGGAEIVHQEHGAIRLEEGCYRTWQQREYVDAANAPRTVRD